MGIDNKAGAVSNRNMQFFSLKFPRGAVLTVLLPLLVCSCVTARSQLDSSLEISPSAKARSPTSISDDDGVPLAQVQERLKNRTKIRFKSIAECDDGSVIPLPEAPRNIDLRLSPGNLNSNSENKDSWKTDQEASRSREHRQCFRAKMHRKKLADTAREVIALYEIQLILAQAKVLLNKKMNVKDIKVQMKELDLACDELLRLKVAIEDPQVNANSQAHKINRIKLENLEWVLEATASVSEKYGKTKDKTKLPEALKEAIVIVEEVLSDFMVDLQNRSYRVRGETMKSLQPIVP